MVERVFELPERRRVNEPGAPYFKPTRFHASLEWSAGDSGSAVLDESGNAVGLVCAVIPPAELLDPTLDAAALDEAKVTGVAVEIRDVLRLTKPSKPR